MNEDAMRSIIVNAVNELAPVLWAAQSAALAAANTRCRGLVHDKYPSLRPHLIRSELREYLEREHLPEGWVLGGDTRKMVQIYVRNETVCLRYLKERRVTYPGGVPAAGRAPSRRAYWAPSLFGPPGLPGGRLNLLLLWDYLDPAAASLPSREARAVRGVPTCTAASPSGGLPSVGAQTGNIAPRPHMRRSDSGHHGTDGGHHLPVLAAGNPTAGATAARPPGHPRSHDE